MLVCANTDCEPNCAICRDAYNVGVGGLTKDPITACKWFGDAIELWDFAQGNSLNFTRLLKNMA